MKRDQWKADFQRLWNELVPAKGQAASVQGELVRAIGRLTDEAYRNGNINWGEGHRALCQYLRTNLRDISIFNPGEIQQINGFIDQMMNYKTLDLSGDNSCYYRLTEMVVRWCQAKKEIIPRKNNPGLLI